MKGRERERERERGNAYCVLAKMLGNLEHQAVLTVLDLQGVQDRGQIYKEPRRKWGRKGYIRLRSTSTFTRQSLSLPSSL